MLELSLSLALSFPALQQVLHQLCNLSEVLLLLKNDEIGFFCLQQKQIFRIEDASVIPFPPARFPDFV